MGLRLLVLVALAAYKCDALPSATDLVVPEGMMMQVAFSSMTPTAFISAMTKSGGSKAQCSTFARTTVDTITTAVSSEQGVLNALANGDECAALGKPLVTSTKDAVVAAQAVVVTKQSEAATALSKKDTACSVGVDFSVGLEALEANSCYDYTSQTGYTQAKATCVSATSALATANAAVVTAQTVVTDAQAAAADAVTEASRLESTCLCRVHKAQTKAWTSAQGDHASHAADWKQAHEILCALDQTTTCTVPTCPAVTQPTLAAGATDEVCSTVKNCVETEADGYISVEELNACLKKKGAAFHEVQYIETHYGRTQYLTNVCEAFGFGSFLKAHGADIVPSHCAEGSGLCQVPMYPSHCKQGWLGEECTNGGGNKNYDGFICTNQGYISGPPCVETEADGFISVAELNACLEKRGAVFHEVQYIQTHYGRTQYLTNVCEEFGYGSYSRVHGGDVYPSVPAQAAQYPSHCGQGWLGEKCNNGGGHGQYNGFICANQG